MRSFRGYDKHRRPDVQRDVTDSQAFADFCGDFVSGDGFRNIVLMVYADGVSMGKRRDNSMFVISAQVLNIRRQERFRLSNMLLLQIIPGPKTPSQIDALLQPLVDDLNAMYKDGISVTVGLDTFTVKVMFVTIVADSRAHPKLTNMMQTPAIYPCHLCELKVREYAWYLHVSCIEPCCSH
jgi:hypothetical protein